MTANPERGEIEIELAGTTYVMRPDFEAVLAIERQTGRPLIRLATEFGLGRHGGLPLSDMAVIVTEGVKAARRGDEMAQQYKAEKFGRLIYETGMLSVLDPVDLFLRNALSGGAEPSKKKESTENQNASSTAD